MPIKKQPGLRRPFLQVFPSITRRSTVCQNSSKSTVETEPSPFDQQDMGLQIQMCQNHRPLLLSHRLWRTLIRATAASVKLTQRDIRNVDVGVVVASASDATSFDAVVSRSHIERGRFTSDTSDNASEVSINIPRNLIGPVSQRNLNGVTSVSQAVGVAPSGACIKGSNTNHSASTERHACRPTIPTLSNMLISSSFRSSKSHR